MAIAYDNSTASGYSGASSTLTFSHTTGSSSNRLLVVGVWRTDGGSGGVTGITYNGVAMSSINNLLMTGAAAGQYLHLWYLLNPTSGANNVIVTASSTSGMYASATTYSGVAQSGQPDANNTQGTSSATSLTTAVTTIADNCWIVGYGYSNNAITAGTNTLLRAGSVAGLSAFDTNGAQTPAGSHSIQTTQTPADFIGHVIASFSPFISTSIKSINGLAIASVKTVNGLAIASVKSINGLA